MGKRGKKPFSIARRMTMLFVLLFSATVILVAFYFFSFAKAKLSEAEKQFLNNAENLVSDINDSIRNIERHLLWLSSNAEEISIWNSNTAYEQLLYQKRIINELQNFILATDGAEAILVAPRNSDIIMEKHTLSDEAMLRMMNTYNGRQIIVPVTPGVFSDNAEEKYSHLVLSYPIYAGNIRNRYGPVTAIIYAAVRAESIIPETSMPGDFFLCIRRGDDLISLARTGSHETDEKNFSFQALNERDNSIWSRDGAYSRIYPLNADDLYLVCLWQRGYLFPQISPILFQGILLSVVILLLILIGNSFLRQSLQQPTGIILRDVERIRQGDVSYRLESGEAEEFARVSESINNLLDELDAKNRKVIAQQKRLYDLEILNRESRILSLQAQINPHFLYNTLECVISMARYYHVPQITTIVMGIIRIYRYGASSKRFGTLKSEFECAQNYANVMNIRYEGRFTFVFQSEPGLDEAEMPRMTIQPLIENALLHGLLRKAVPGIVETIAKRDADDLLISVHDNGTGITEPDLETLRNHLCESTSKEQGSIGLSNVHSRLMNEYGESYGLTIESVEGSYTTVTVRLPICKKEEEDAS